VQACRLEPRVDQRIADQWPGAVVDDDKVGRVPAQTQQAEADRILAAFPTELDIDRFPPAVAFELPGYVEQVALGDHQCDACDVRTAIEGLERTADQRPASDRQQDPCTRLALVKPGPGGRDDGLYLHS